MSPNLARLVTLDISDIAENLIGSGPAIGLFGIKNLTELLDPLKLAPR